MMAIKAAVSGFRAVASHMGVDKLKKGTLTKENRAADS